MIHLITILPFTAEFSKRSLSLRPSASFPFHCWLSHNHFDPVDYVASETGGFIKWNALPTTNTQYCQVAVITAGIVRAVGSGIVHPLCKLTKLHAPLSLSLMETTRFSSGNYLNYWYLMKLPKFLCKLYNFPPSPNLPPPPANTALKISTRHLNPSHKTCLVHNIQLRCIYMRVHILFLCLFLFGKCHTRRIFATSLSVS